jgi:hypothetical protein
MKQILSLALFLLPCLAWAQYPSNGNQKITLGEQTTADGLIWRGVLADTGIITPLSDTSAYIILDTVNHRFYNYNRATNVWSVAGGGTAVTSITGGTGLTGGTITSTGTLAADTSFLFTQSDTLSLNLTNRFALKLNIADTSNIKYVNTYGTQTVNGLKTFTDTVRIEDAIKVGANNAYVYSAGTGNYYFTKDYKNQNGLYHIAIGNGVLSNATTVSDPTSSRHGSVAIGFNNLKNLNQSGGGNNGLYNTSIGYNNMSSMTTGSFNTAIGADALKSMTTGFSNAGLGSSTLESSTTGERNLAIGNGALRFITTGNDNIGIGSNAGIFDAVGGDFVTSLNNSIYIGSRADPSAITGVTNEIVIGKDAKGQGSNSIMLGNSSVTNAYCYDTSLSSPSDFRDKTNIENLQTGLDLIMSLRPVKFQWNMRDYGKVGYKDIGFIAQEALDVQNVNNEADNIKLVSDENQNQLSMQSANLIPILVKAIQDQQAQIELLKQRLLILENK